MKITTKELAELAGVTYRQLDHWATHKYVPGGQPGTGIYRTYDREQALVVLRFAALVKAGLRPEAAAEHTLGNLEVFIRVNHPHLERKVDRWASTQSMSQPAEKQTVPST